MRQACVDGCLAIEEFFWEVQEDRERIWVLAVESHHFHTKAANVYVIVQMFNYYAKIICRFFRKRH